MAFEQRATPGEGISGRQFWLRAWLPWIAGATLLLCGSALLTWISPRFIFGQGHAARPIPEMLVYYALMWLGFAFACYAVFRKRPVPIVFVFVVALAARAILFPSNLIQENDVYRYVLDGQAVIHGINPFKHRPDDVAAQARPEFQVALEQPEAQLVLSRISYGDLPTIYPPLAQASFAMGALLGGWDWLGQRAIFGLYDVAAMGLLLVVLQRLALPPGYAVFYVWNPIILKEIWNSTHSDSLAVLMFMVMLLGCVQASRAPGYGGPVVASLGLAGAILARLYPVMLIPALLAFLVRLPNGGRRVLVAACVLGGAILLGYAPFLGVGLERITESLRAYGDQWVRNAGAFHFFLAASDYMIDSEDWASRIARMAAAACVAAFALGWAAWILLRGRGAPLQLVRAMQGTLLVWMLLTPTAFPWYTAGLLAISAFRPRLWVVVMSGALGLYYTVFLYSYRDYPPIWDSATAWIQHGAIWAAVLMAPLLQRYRRLRTL